MKATLIVSALTVMLCAGSAAEAKSGGHGSHSGGSHATKGYTKKDGTHVAPSHATNPNKSKRDNWSSKGNRNPHTGKDGTKDPDKAGK